MHTDKISSNNSVKIIALWVVFLFGMVFHTQLAVMPILYGQNVAMPNSTGTAPEYQLWLMLGFFALPMLAIMATVFNQSKRYRKIHFYLTVFYSLMNLGHIISDLMVSPIEWYQIALLSIVFVDGILLNIVAYDWMKERINEEKRLERSRILF